MLCLLYLIQSVCRSCTTRRFCDSLGQEGSRFGCSQDISWTCFRSMTHALLICPLLLSAHRIGTGPACHRNTSHAPSQGPSRIQKPCSTGMTPLNFIVRAGLLMCDSQGHDVLSLPSRRSLCKVGICSCFGRKSPHECGT